MNEDERTVPQGAGDAGDDRDEAFAHLVASDPAHGTAPRAGVLRAKVDALRADDAAEAEPAAEALPDGVRPLRSARQRLPWLAAACVAGLVVVGGGGYVLGAGTGGGGASDSAGGAEPAVVLGGGAAGGGGQAADGAMGGDAAAAEDSASSLAGDRAMPSWYSSGRASFHADGLSTAAGTAAAYGLDASDAATREGAARVADALGVEGEPRWEYGSWSVGSQDGAGPSVWLSADGSASFGYNDPAADPWVCGAGVVTEDGEDTPASDARDCEGPRTSKLSDDAARSALADVMEQVGVDPADFEIVVEEQGGGDPARWVTAYQVIDDRRTGAQWSATVGEAGIAWLDGFLARTVELGDYPVVSPAEAVERLGDPRYSGSAWPVVYAEDEMVAEPYDEQTDPTPPPAPLSPGDPVEWPVSDVEIVEARLGLAMQYEVGGAVMIAPAYELSDAAGNSWSVLAVADDAVDYSAAR